MGEEIERKFLVSGDQWRAGSKPIRTCQGYLPSGNDTTVRVRVQDERAWLTIKGKTEGLSRLEYEYAIPVSDAEEILARLCQRPYIEKNRYRVNYAGMTWEVDEFLQENAGLIVAEVELSSEEERIELPPWVGEEVTHDPRYLNINLMKHPYSQWGKRPVE